MAKLDYQTKRVGAKHSDGGVPATELVVPLVLLCAGLTTFTISAFVMDGRRAATEVLLAILLVTAAQTLVGIGVAYVTAMLLGASFGPLKTAFLKLAAILVFTGAASWVLPGGGWFGIFIYFGLLVWLFELETYEAGVFAVLFSLVRFVLFLVAAAALR